MVLEELSLRVVAAASYVEQRLRPRIAVSLAEVEAYYRSDLASRMAAAGEELPELEEDDVIVVDVEAFDTIGHQLHEGVTTQTVGTTHVADLEPPVRGRARWACHRDS